MLLRGAELLGGALLAHKYEALPAKGVREMHYDLNKSRIIQLPPGRTRQEMWKIRGLLRAFITEGHFPLFPI